MKVLASLKERTQYYVVREIVRVWHHPDGVVVYGVAPTGVHAQVWLAAGNIDGSVKGYRLGLLAETVVAVGILQGKNPIPSRRNALDGEASAAVGAGYAYKRLGTEKAVGIRAVGTIQANEHALDRFHILCGKNMPRHFHRVYYSAGTETVGIETHGVALVVILDGVAEVHGICDIALQGVEQGNLDLLACRTHIGHLQLWRRDDNLLVGIGQSHELVEVYAYLLRLHVDGPVGRTGADHLRRFLVIPASVRSADVGTGHDGQHGCEQYQKEYGDSTHCLILFR